MGTRCRKALEYMRPDPPTPWIPLCQNRAVTKWDPWFLGGPCFLSDDFLNCFRWIPLCHATFWPNKVGSMVQDPAKDAGIIRIIHRTMPDIHRMRIIPCRMHILRHRIATFDKESKGAAFGRAPQGRFAPLWLLSLSNVAILWLRMCILRGILCILCMSGMVLWIICIFPPSPTAEPSLSPKIGPIFSVTIWVPTFCMTSVNDISTFPKFQTMEPSLSRRAR